MEEFTMLEKQNFEMMRQDGDFEIAPCATNYDFDDKQRFTKLIVSPEQKKHISAMINQMPNALASGSLAQAYCVSFPEGVPHTLTALKQGGYGSMVKGVDGKFAGSASFHPLQAQAVMMGAFTAMSVASGQYFLAQINRELNMMSLKIDKILEFLYGDKKAELMSELTFIKYAYENYSSIMLHEEQRVATIISIQEAKKVAMKDIEFYMGDLDSTVVADKKQYSDLGTLINKAFQIRDCLELSMQLYVMSSLLEMYYAQNYDDSYISFLETTVTAYIDKCEKRILSCFSVLNGRFNEFKGNLVKKNDTSAFEIRVQAQIDSLNNGEESNLRKTLHSALQESTKKTEFYLRKDGNIYIKAS